MQDSGLFYNLVKWVLSAAALMITAYVIPGFRLKDFKSALIAAAVIGLANLFVKPILFVLTLPLTILTLGLFYFVLNAIILKMCASILKGFEIRSWASAILGAVVLAIVSLFFDALLFGSVPF